MILLSPCPSAYAPIKPPSDVINYPSQDEYGTATVNASKGNSSFSTATASGQYVLTMSPSVTAILQNLMDCYAPVGTDGGGVKGSFAPCMIPLASTGTMSTNSVSGNATQQ